MDEFVKAALDAIKERNASSVSLVVGQGEKVTAFANYETQYFDKRFALEIDSRAQTVTAKNVLSGIKENSPLHHEVFDVIRNKELIVRFTPIYSEGNISVVYEAKEQDKTDLTTHSVTYCVEKLITLIFVIYQRAYHVGIHY